MPVTIYHTHMLPTYAHMLPTYAYFQNRNKKSMRNLKPPKQNSALCNCSKASDFCRDVAACHHHRWILTSLLTFTGLVLALLTTHSQLHWLHTAANGQKGSSGRDQQLLAICTVLCVSLYPIYRVSQEEWTKLRESVPYVELYRYNPKHLYRKLNGFGDNGHRKVWASGVSTYCTPSVTPYSSTAHARQPDTAS